MARRGRVRVVIVVPAFAEGHQRDPPVVARIVAGGKAARSPHVGGGVDQPSGMQADDDAQAKFPRRPSSKPPMATGSRPAAHREPSDNCSARYRTVLGQIGRVLRHQAGVVVVGFAQEDPAAVRPPGSVVRRVRIARLVGFLMMDPVRGDPENGSAFEASARRKRRRNIPSSRHLIGPVRMQPVVAHADPQAGGNQYRNNVTARLAQLKINRAAMAPMCRRTRTRVVGQFNFVYREIL